MNTSNNEYITSNFERLILGCIDAVGASFCGFGITFRREFCGLEFGSSADLPCEHEHFLSRSFDVDKNFLPKLGCTHPLFQQRRGRGAPAPPSGMPPAKPGSRKLSVIDVKLRRHVFFSGSSVTVFPFPLMV